MRKKLEYINLKRGLNEALEIKSIQDIEALFNISWEEGVQGPQLDSVTLQHLKFLPEKKKDNIFRQIAKNQKNLALVCMDDDLGYGVFATADIPGGTFITTYGGAQVDFQSNNHQTSDYNICGNEQGLRFGVNAANHRNWGGFLQHLPGTDLNDYVFDCAETRKSVATANVKVSLYQYKGCKGQSSWGFFIRTERDISAGEILGYDYGNVHNAQDRTFSKMVAPKSYDYWRIAQKTPLLFDTFGKKIAISAYRFVGRLSLLFYDEKQSVITHRLWASEIKSIHNKQSVYMITNHLFVSAKAILQKIEENPGSPWLSFFELKTNYIVTEKIKVALFCNDVFVQEPSSLEKIDQLAADENNHRPICITVRNESNVIDIYAASREQFMKAYEQWDKQSWLIVNEGRLLTSSETQKYHEEGIIKNQNKLKEYITPFSSFARAYCHFVIAQHYFALKKLEEAEENCNLALTSLSIAETINDTNYGEHKEKFSELLMQIKPKPSIQPSLFFAPPPENQGEQCYKAAIQSFNNKNYQQAIEQLNRALGFFVGNTEGIKKQQASCYSTLASCYRELGQFAEAQQSCQQALMRLEGIDVPQLKQQITIKLAGIMEKMNEYNSTPNNLPTCYG